MTVMPIRNIIGKTGVITCTIGIGYWHNHMLLTISNALAHDKTQIFHGFTEIIKYEFLFIFILFISGPFLYTKLGPVSGTKFFPNWLKKFPIDMEHSQLAEKSQIKR